jgi:hypothetical protein
MMGVENGPNEFGERNSTLAARILTYMRQHAIASVALVCSILALAGASFAASSPRATSRQARQSQLDQITTAATAWAIIGPKGRVLAGRGHPKPAEINPGVYVIGWGVTFPSTGCATVAGIDLGHSPSTETIRAPHATLVPWVAGYAVANSFTKNGQSTTGVDTFNQRGWPRPLGFDVALIC